MSEAITRILNGVLDREGEQYTNDPNDAGGPTKWGITQKTLSVWLGHPATEDDVKNLDRTAAFQIYEKMYVVDPQFDKVASMSELIGDELVDSGVNCGVSTASIWLQKILNALNRQQKDWPDLIEDGSIGQKTLDALTACLSKRSKQIYPGTSQVSYSEGEEVVWRYLNALQGAYYITISRTHQNDEEFVFGWGLNRLGGRP